MTLVDHLNELRKRIIICMLFVVGFSMAAYPFYYSLSDFFMAPFHAISSNGATIHVNTLYEGFFVKIKLALIAGIILSLPMIVFQICRFVIPGLKKSEIKWLFIVLFFSSSLSIASTYMGYVLVLPTVVTFLLNQSFIPHDIVILLNFKQNISVVISFLLGGIVIFQSPIILCFLLAKNILTRRYLIQNSRFFILGIVVISAMITPPDIFSQLSLALPLIICYFACILIAKAMGWGTPC